MKIKETYRCARCMCELKEEHTFCQNCGHDQRQGNPERALPAGTLLNDKYLIGAVIGEGGFGITYAAWDTLIETRIAIKEYFPSELVTRDTTLSGEKAAHDLTLIQEKTGEGRYREGLEQFVKEAGNLAKFQKQPGVVSVKDFFYENNTAYMVMEYIEGVTLNSYLENHNGKLGTQETFQMIEPVMKTLEAIHREGVIHRDISPDNIMVTEDGQMKLIDFGAARFVGADDEKSLTVILKHGYAPEEQYRSNGEQGPWTDVYALSAVIYRMLTGKVPAETLKRMTGGQDDVHAELKKVPGLSGAERRGLERGLAVKAEKRLRSMEELHKEIYSGTKVPLWKWLAGAAVLFAVVLSICFVRLLDRRDRKLAALAEIQEREALEKKTLVPEREEEPEKETEEDREEEEAEEVGQPQDPEEEVVPESLSEEELMALIEEESGKYIGNVHIYEDGKEVSKKTACYDDFDGDGRYELFAYVADEWELDGYDQQTGTGCSIWFSDGEETVRVTDIEDWLYLYEIGTLQFGKSKHFNLRRGVGTLAGGSKTTTCALVEGIPQVVLIDEYVTLGSEEGKTYCLKMQYNPYDDYASARYYEHYSIFYRDGGYWEYASKIISEEDLLKYSNGAEIIDQIKEETGKLYIPWEEDSHGWERDFTQYPYIEVESLLLNSENEEIIVNMRHWKSGEEAAYYKSLTGDDLINATLFRDISIDGIACLLSETRLSANDNLLQIEEMRYGHREIKGTEFTPLYPD